MNRLILIPMIVGACATNSALAADLKRFAILDTKVEGGADPVIGTQMTARLAEAIGARPGVTVIAPDDLRAMLEQQTKKQLLGCADDGCLAEIAGALGVDALVAGRASKVEGGYAIAVSLIDAKDGQGIGRVVETWRGESIALLELVEPIVDQLFAEKGTKLVGSVQIQGASSGSQVIVDNQVRGDASSELNDVPVGARKIQIVEDGYEPIERFVIVKKGSKTMVAVEQRALASSEFYETWWFWTIAGVGVAGAAVGTALLVSSGGDGGGATGVNVSVNADAALGGR